MKKTCGLTVNSPLQAPEVDCIAKGKARVRYERGCKLSIATSLDEGFILGMRSFAGNPYDSHTLREALEQVKSLPIAALIWGWSIAVTSVTARPKPASLSAAPDAPWHQGSSPTSPPQGHRA